MGTSIRSPSRSRLSGALLVGLALGMAPSVVRAESAEARAKAEYQRGHKAYDLGNFEEALGAYTAAYSAKPLPGFLFNIAQCHRQLGRYERAAFFYQRFLDESGDSPNAETARTLLAEVKARQAEQSQKADAAAAEKREQDLADARARAAHEEAEAAAQRKAELDAQVAADRASAAPALGPSAAAPTDLAGQGRQSAERVSATATTTAPEPSKPLVKEWWFWTATGAGAVIVAAVVVYAASVPHAPSPSLGTIHAQ